MDILIAGNTGIFDTEQIRQAFDDDLAVVLSDHRRQSVKNVRWYSFEWNQKNLNALFHDFDFEVAVFLSSNINMKNDDGEMDQLRLFLHVCALNRVSRFVYVGTNCILSSHEDSHTVVWNSLETLCAYYKAKYQMDVKIIRSPFITNINNPDDYWRNVFDTLEETGKFTFHAAENQLTDFMDAGDLADFLRRIASDWRKEDHQINLFVSEKKTYKEAAEKLVRRWPEARITFTDLPVHGLTDELFNQARKYYGWLPEHEVISDLPDYIEAWGQYRQKNISVFERIYQKLYQHNLLKILIEMTVFAVITEGLVLAAGNSVQFRMIDLRLLYIILFASAYGVTEGILAAVIMGFSLLLSYYQRGSSWMLLFYDAANWLPFIFYGIAGAVPGYLRQKNDENMQFLKAENDRLQADAVYMNQLYEDSIRYKNKYRHELIESRGGFGRIFDVVQQLSDTDASQIFAKAIPVIENVLDTHGAAIYAISRTDDTFARLEVCSEAVASRLSRSISLKDYTSALKTLNEGKVWFNAELTPSRPSYMAGIRDKDGLRVLIMIYDSTYEQVDNYYMNLIRILAGLLENFLLKAWSYGEAMAKENYIEGTILLKPDALKKELATRRQMENSKVATYTLFSLDTGDRSLSEINTLLTGRIRFDDIAGIDQNGHVFIIASQVEETGQKVIIDRFARIGITAHVVQKGDEA